MICLPRILQNQSKVFANHCLPLSAFLHREHTKTPPDRTQGRWKRRIHLPFQRISLGKRTQADMVKLPNNPESSAGHGRVGSTNTERSRSAFKTARWLDT
eukprot:scaffold543_cov119-Cylindrotheca_fusiformis.AAC.14